MKKILSLVLILVLLFSITSAFAEERDPANWDVSGNWLLNFQGEEQREFRNLVQDEEGNVTGEFWYLENGEWLKGGTLNGYVSGDDIYLYYLRPIEFAYDGDFYGTISWDGMSGNFTDGRNDITWYTVDMEPELLWDARISGGGQLLAETEELAKNKKPINYKISFGGGSYVSNGDLYFDGLEVTFHNVSNENVIGGKFIGEELHYMNFGFNEGVANYKVSGTFNGESGYYMIVRVQDSGEPNFNSDNLRFELHGDISYDSFTSGDFPGESEVDGTARNSLERGNIQVDNGGYSLVN